jgi:hypothetical protein
MKEATKRSVVRWIHIVFSIPILGRWSETTRMKTGQDFKE